MLTLYFFIEINCRCIDIFREGGYNVGYNAIVRRRLPIFGWRMPGYVKNLK